MLELIDESQVAQYCAGALWYSFTSSGFKLKNSALWNSFMNISPASVSSSYLISFITGKCHGNANKHQICIQNVLQQD